MKRRHIPYLLSACAVIFAVGLYLFWAAYYDRKVPNFSKQVVLYVYPGSEPDSVYNQICSSGSVRNVRSLKRIMKNVTSVRPGHYVISDRDPSIYVGRMLTNGWQSPINLVLSGSLRLQSGIAAKISRQMLLDSIDVIKAMRDSSLLASYGFTTENVFALFMPDTYQIYWTDSMKKVLDKQKKAYDTFWTEDNQLKAKNLGLSKIQVAILASIVRGESNYIPEYPAIAGVYLNRYKIGMKLQADPTVAFCFDYSLNRIYKVHTKVDSPYNTYMNVGLPPAPICVPTRESLSAVLNPDRHGYLFFCASPAFDGTHLFAKTYSEHLLNARAFQRALDAPASQQAAISDLP